MRAGQLRHRLTLQSLSRVQDAYGEAVETWTDYATVWGSLSPGRGREFQHAHQIHAEIEYEAHIRYRDDVKPTDRVIADGRTFEVVSIRDFDLRHIRQILMLKEIIDD